MARDQPASGRGTSARRKRPRRRPRRRACCAKGCKRSFTPSRWNQRCCDQEACSRRVRRWQATARQQRRRATEAGRKEHRQAEAKRRKAVRAAETTHALVALTLALTVTAQAAEPPEPVAAKPEPQATELPATEPSEPVAAELPAAELPAAELPAAELPAAELPESLAVELPEPQAVDDSKVDDAPQVDDAGVGVAASDAVEVTARGHALLALLCDRPGCFRVAARVTPHETCYCGPVCRRTMRRVLDREQRWLSRGALRGLRGCIRELARRREAGEEGADKRSRYLRELHRQSAEES
jgi:hypothetical protein